jgi:hypothetical protein
MYSVLVYESMYGNSRRVAEEIGAVLAQSGRCEVVPVSLATAELLADADLLVVGGPTHAHTMSSRQSRASAREVVDAGAQKPGAAQLELDAHATDPGLRDWFKALAEGDGTMAAAFDTRLDARALLTGRASRAIASRLRRHGYRLIAEPESFLVDKQTRLLDSEAGRARSWAHGLATAATSEAPEAQW